MDIVDMFLVGHLFNFFLLSQMMSFTTFIILKIVETMALILGFGIVCSILIKFSGILRESNDKKSIKIKRNDNLITNILNLSLKLVVSFMKVSF